MDRDRILRIIDANLNRSREALRSLEEAARLGMDDARIASRLKDLRHGLREYEATLGLRPGDLASFRDPEGDVGRCAPAAPYGAVEELATANARRLSEALRVLEEYGRLFGKGSETASRIRFEAYALEKILVPGIRTRTALNSARLYFILNADLPDKDPFALARASRRRPLQDAEGVHLGHPPVAVDVHPGRIGRQPSGSHLQRGQSIHLRAAAITVGIPWQETLDLRARGRREGGKQQGDQDQKQGCTPDQEKRSQIAHE